MTDNQARRQSVVARAFVKSLPVMAGYVVLGMGFGVLMTDRGYPLMWAAACSLLIYAGSMQYVTVDLLATAASPLYAALMTLMVNARHLFYGVSMIGKYRDMGRSKPYLIFGLTDETYSILCDEREFADRRQAERYCLCLTGFNQAYWVGGTVLGAALGTVIPFNTQGIEFSMTALFLTVFVEQWLTAKDHMPALTGLIATVACLMIFGSDSFLIPAMLIITLVLASPLGKRGERRE